MGISQPSLITYISFDDGPITILNTIHRGLKGDYTCSHDIPEETTTHGGFTNFNLIFSWHQTSPLKKTLVLGRHAREKMAFLEGTKHWRRRGTFAGRAKGTGHIPQELSHEGQINLLYLEQRAQQHEWEHRVIAKSSKIQKKRERVWVQMWFWKKMQKYCVLQHFMYQRILGTRYFFYIVVP